MIETLAHRTEDLERTTEVERGTVSPRCGVPTVEEALDGLESGALTPSEAEALLNDIDALEEPK